jgi:DMSO/TMAO reductase YedYZ heme-binding membrane subunit
MRFHAGHAGVAAGLFLVELGIALFVDDNFVRPYLGDVLVIPLVYCFVATWFELAPLRLGLGVLAFAFGVEFAQYFQIVFRLGLAHNTIARTVIGTAYSPLDFVAYTVGAMLTVTMHQALRRRLGRP